MNVIQQRGRPAWIQAYFANGTKSLMSNWTGRQVIDPNKSSEETGEGIEEATEDVSKSGVLV